MKRPSSPKTHSSLIGILAVSTLAFFAFAGCDKTVAVTGVRLDKTSISLTEGESANLVATVEPATSTNGSVTWTSTDAAVASVNNGLVKALKEGSTTVTVTTADGGKIATCSVTVKSAKIPVTGVTLDKAAETLVAGATLQLTATVKPDNATDKSATWSSSNSSVADVDADGLVSAKSTGESTITVTTTDGGKMATCDVKVKEMGINIPDANFKAYLVANFDNDGDKEISLDEATAVKGIDCSEKSISSLEGIQYFTSLTLLICYFNQLSSIDVSYNTALTDIFSNNNQLTSLDVSKNTALTKLTCNDNQLTSLDVSNNTALTELYCYNNQLTSLDVSNNTALTTLYCSKNQLTSLDVSNNTALTELKCYNNRFTSLDASTMANQSNFILYCGQQKTADGSNSTLDLTLVTAQKKRWTALINSEYKDYNTNVNVTYKDAGDYIYINIPDANFKAYLVANFDKDGDKEISLNESAAVTTIDCSSKSIASLEGIQYFTSLTFLNCDRNRLKSLDVGKNTALTLFECSENQLTSLDVSKSTSLTFLNCYSNQLTNLDVGKNTALTYIDCSNNQLTNLDVSNSTSLTELNCYSNQLTNLDVGKNTALTHINCSYNQLTNLNVSNSTSLTELNCHSNQITSLDVSKNTALKSLVIEGSKLTILDVSKNTALTWLNCNSNRLTSLDISKNTALTSLGCSSNQLTNLDVSSNTALSTLSCYGNRLTSLDASTMANQSGFTLYCGQQKSAGGSDATLNLTLVTAQKTRWEALLSGQYKNFNKNVSVTYKDAGDYVNIPDANFKAYLVATFDKDGDKEISLDEAAAVSKIHCNQKRIASLEGIQYFTSLTELNCYSNQLTSLDVSNNKALTGLDCYSNQITSLDVSKNTALTYIDCSYNQLTSLNVGKNTALTYLSCYGNRLTSLDVGKNTALTYLSCYGNQLTSLDASTMANQSGFELYCGQQKSAGGSEATLNLTLVTAQKTRWEALLSGQYKNFNTNVNVTYKDGGDNINIPDANFKAYLVANFDKDGDMEISLAEAAAVTGINCYSKSIASLEGIQYLTSLTELDCSSNRLTSLDVGKNTALTELYCNDNSLTSLDVSKNTELTNLSCDSNQLTSLDVSNNTALTAIDCQNNRLTSLDVSKNTALTHLICGINQLTSLDVSKNTALTMLGCSNNQLTGLDVSKNTELTNLSCDSNQLTSLNVSKNTALTYLFCYNNQLTSLDASTMAYQSVFELACGQQKSAGGSDATLNLTLVMAQKPRWEWLSTDRYSNRNTNVNVTYI